MSMSMSMSTEVEGEKAVAKAAAKRYEGLIMVRNKAVKGKGAWYWGHLEPLLVHNAENGLPKCVKLKCCLCGTLFSASNPSRTASEHLKKGTCPNFTTPQNPLSPLAPVVTSSTTTAAATTTTTTPYAQFNNHRKRSSSGSSGDGCVVVPTIAPTSYVSPISVMGGGGAMVVHTQPPYHHHNQLALSCQGSGSSCGAGGGGRDDLSHARDLFEDSVKRLKSPKASPGTTLSKLQLDCALDYLGDWLFELCGSVSFSSIEHPKFKSFLHQVGMPQVSKNEFSGSRLDARYEEARNEAELRIRDAQFFQLASYGWKPNVYDHNLVNLILNLPNGTSVYRRAVFTGAQVPSKYAEEVLMETIADICGTNVMHQCVGIVADKFKNSALMNLEAQNHWMVNLSCQYQALHSLIKDFYRELPLFKTVTENCFKLANLVNNTTTVRNSFHKYQLRECGHAGLIRMPMKEHQILNLEPVYAMVEDIMSSARVLQLVVLDESYKLVSMEEGGAREFGEMIRDVGFWNDLEAVRSLVSLVKEMAHDFEIERPLVGQCLPLWEELRTKVKDWCRKFHIAETIVEKVIERRFRKNYHPAWAAAYILDPLCLMRDSSGKYLPPFQCLTQEQEQDVDKLIKRLVPREEMHIAVMELMKWRAGGLDPVYAQAVQLKQRDPCSGKLKIANPHGSRLVWETYLPQFKSLGKVAVRLIFLHGTAPGFKCNPSFLKWVQSHGRSRSGMDRAQKMIFIAAHSRLERRDFTTDQDKDVELFASANEASDSDVGTRRLP